MSEEAIKELVRQRGTYKGRVTKYKDYLSVIQQIDRSNITLVQIKELSLRLARLQTLFSEFDSVQTQIEMKSSKLEEQMEERDNMETQFISLISATQEIIDSHPSNSDHGSEVARTAQSSLETGSVSKIRLPTISLPSFDGNYLKWLEFRDTFEAMIHVNESIPDINKYHYLRSSLEGSASVVIKSLEFTAKNYKMAWELLCERYDNKNLLINNHMKALFNIDQQTRESHRSIRYLIDHVTKNLSALKSLGRPTESWDDVIIYLIASKLDPTTSRKWEEYKADLTDMPTLPEFLKFLRSRADVLETMVACRSDKPAENKYLQPKTTKAFVAAASTSQKQETHSNKSTKSPPTCPVCHGAHRISECVKFKAMNVESRSSEVLKLNLCLNCLRRGHNVEQCRLVGSCQVCKERHNTLLHKYSQSLSLQADNKTAGPTPVISAASACAANETADREGTFWWDGP
ncbi:uncharacterized protein LOC125235873 [Leguminivora glycinivorella]|uniref:uncharacterized protein LOC125235873 n=1 Tax=Leguminivora glycinivorella TaxID=1035111 RepID=UPI00200BA6C4|nr:uncharacterized protein LOC125235873 [Leguminivora glycinivorella]